MIKKEFERRLRSLMYAIDFTLTTGEYGEETNRHIHL